MQLTCQVVMTHVSDTWKLQLNIDIIIKILFLFLFQSANYTIALYFYVPIIVFMLIYDVVMQPIGKK